MNKENHRILGSIRGFFLAIWLLISFPILATSFVLPWFLSYIPVMLSYRGLLFIMGLRVNIRGNVEKGTPTLFISNHCSYLDIMVLGSYAPAGYVAKSEIKTWPVLGWLGMLARTVFVDRKVSKTLENLALIKKKLQKRQSLVLFPEGTTSDGNSVLNFRSSFFRIIEEDFGDKSLLIQPVSIAYTGLNGKPVGDDERNVFAWYGDMELVPHLWTLLKQRRSEVELVFYEPLTEIEQLERKEVASQCHDIISSGVANMLSKN